FDKQMIRLLEIAPGRERTFEAIEYCFSPDGSQLAVVEHCDHSRGQQLRIVETASGREIAFVARGVGSDLHGVRGFFDVAYLPDGRTLTYTIYKSLKSVKNRAARVRNKQYGFCVVLWDLKSSQRRRTIAIAGDLCHAIAPNGKLLAALSGHFR